MKKKKDIYFIILFLIIVSISFAYLFQASYAKYKRQIEGNADATVANWNIKVNTETINNKSVLTNSIIPTIDSNQYIKSGVIAPGSTGYFTLTIDATEADVDFSYEISGAVHEDTPLNDLVVTEYSQGGARIPYNSANKITGDITKNTPSTTITIYFKWDDNALTETMDNQDDTEYAIDPDNATTKIKVSIKFTQKPIATQTPNP